MPLVHGTFLAPKQDHIPISLANWLSAGSQARCSSDKAYHRQLEASLLWGKTNDEYMHTFYFISNPVSLLLLPTLRSTPLVRMCFRPRDSGPRVHGRMREDQRRGPAGRQTRTGWRRPSGDRIQTRGSIGRPRTGLGPAPEAQEHVDGLEREEVLATHAGGVADELQRVALHERGEDEPGGGIVMYSRWSSQGASGSHHDTNLALIGTSAN